MRKKSLFYKNAQYIFCKYFLITYNRNKFPDMSRLYKV